MCSGGGGVGAVVRRVRGEGGDDKGDEGEEGRWEQGGFHGFPLVDVDVTWEGGERNNQRE